MKSGFLMMAVWVFAGCGGAPGGKQARTPESATGAETGGLTLTSPAFAEGEMIPRAFTCDGEDRSPALDWSGVPSGTAALALICDDPDAPNGDWVHWVVYDLPAEARGLPEGVEPVERPAQGGVHGQNSWGRLGYGGPCPPSGTHRYFFKLVALDAPLALGPGADKAEVLKAMEGHVVAEARLLGRYRRS